MVRFLKNNVFHNNCKILGLLFFISFTLSAQNDSGQEAVAAVVKPSTQGWVLFNVPWYVWLLVAAIIFTAYRWVRVVTARNAN